jgi:hypothetical protein
MKRYVTLLVFFAVLAGVVAQAQFMVFDPALRWHQIETPHFYIVYHQGLEHIAQESAVIAEESYEIIKREFDRAPASKVHIVIFDVADQIIGSATTIPQHIIYIGPAQMRLADWANVRLDSWIRTLVYHELLHIMDLDMASGWNALLRKIFGNIIMPNFGKPITFIEGLAVYKKYKHLGESRLNDAHTMMMIRQMVLDNKIPRFDEISRFYHRQSWPRVGLLLYNFSAWFLRYIEETYGSDSMKKFNDVNSAELLNLLFLAGFGANFDVVLKRVVKDSADTVYAGFQRWLQQRFSEEIEAITKEGLTGSLRLTRWGWGSGQPSWSPDGKEIVYRHSGPGRSGLRILDAHGQRDREMLFGPMQLPSFSPDGRSVLFSKLDYNGLFYAHSDLYLYDLEKKNQERLTQGARAYFAVFAPDGQTIYFAHHIGRDASTAISAFDLKTQKIRAVKEFPDNSITVHSIAVSPDGKTLALSLWRRGGYQDIYLLPAEGGELQPVTQDKDEDLDPTFSPDGQYLLFSSDRGERRVANLYAYRLSDGSFYRVTNLLTGAFDPAISPDGGSVVFTSYSSDGYDLHKMPFDPQTWKPVSIQKETIPSWTGFPKTDYPITPYRVLPSLLPKLWLPIGGEGMLGLVTFGQDVLSKYSYQLMTGWDFAKRKLVYSLDFAVARFLPVLTLSVSESRDERAHGLGVLMPLELSVARSQMATLTYRRTEYLEKTSSKEIYTAQYNYQSVGGFDLWRAGFVASIQGHLELPSDAKALRKLILSLNETLRLPVHETHTLSLKLSAGWSDAEKSEDGFSLGGEHGTFAVRGFAKKLQQGKQALASSVNYSFPLVNIERGVDYWPVFLDELRGSIFIDAGLAGERLDINELKVGFGAELSVQLTTGYFFNWALRLGVAQGLGEASPKFYLSVGL